ncbi:hypothetical protein H1R20_g5546, partial [Candolleomyces eurysporus]
MAPAQLGLGLNHALNALFPLHANGLEPFLSRIPWRTGLIPGGSARLSSRLARENPYYDLADCMDNVGRALFASGSSLVWMGVINVFVRPPEETLRPNSIVALGSTPVFERVTTILTAYRVLDTFACLHEEAPIPAIPVPRRFAWKPHSVGWPKSLHDWPKLLAKAQSNVKQAMQGLQYIAFEEKDNPFRGLAALYKMKAMQDGAYILASIQLCALHLAMIRNLGSDQKQDLPNQIIPAMPASADGIIKHAERMTSAKMNQEAEDYIRRVVEGDRSRVDTPLVHSLLLSPLSVLVGNAVTRKYDRETAIIYSYCLGNERPALLSQIETTLFMAIHDVSMDSKSVFEALPAFFNDLDWDAIGRVSDTERKWFQVDLEQAGATKAASEPTKVADDAELMTASVGTSISGELSHHEPDPAHSVTSRLPNASDGELEVQDTHDPSSRIQPTVSSADVPVETPPADSAHNTPSTSGSHTPRISSHADPTAPISCASPPTTLSVARTESAEQATFDNESSSGFPQITTLSSDIVSTQRLDALGSPASDTITHDSPEDLFLSSSQAESLDCTPEPQTSLSQPPNPATSHCCEHEILSSFATLSDEQTSSDDLEDFDETSSQRSSNSSLSPRGCTPVPASPALPDHLIVLPDQDYTVNEYPHTSSFQPPSTHNSGESCPNFAPLNPFFHPSANALSSDFDGRTTDCDGDISHWLESSLASSTLFSPADEFTNLTTVYSLDQELCNVSSPAFQLVASIQPSGSEIGQKRPRSPDECEHGRGVDSSKKPRLEASDNQSNAYTSISHHSVEPRGLYLSSHGSASCPIDISELFPQSLPEVLARVASEDENVTFYDQHISNESGSVDALRRLPMSRFQALAAPFHALETIAYSVTFNRGSLFRMDVPPSHTVHWHIILSEGGTRSWQTAPDGFGTEIVVLTGELWIVLCRPPDGQDHKVFGWATAYLNFFEKTDDPEGPFKLEAIRLRCGESCLLKPNTLYFMYAIETTVCRGRYFYPSTDLQGIQFGIIHTFVLGRLVSPDTVSNSRSLISRIILFLHDLLVMKRHVHNEVLSRYIPKLDSFDSVLELFSMINTGVLFPVFTKLRRRTPEEVSYACLIRGAALDMGQWFFHQYELTSTSSGAAIDGPQQFWGKYLTMQSVCIYQYKLEADRRYPTFSTSVSATDLLSEISNCVKSSKLDNWNDAVFAIDNCQLSSLAWCPVAGAQFGIRERPSQAGYPTSPLLLFLP